MELNSTSVRVFRVSLPGLQDVPDEFAWDPVMEGKCPTLSDKDDGGRFMLGRLEKGEGREFVQVEWYLPRCR